MPRQDSRAHAIVARLSEGNASPDEVFAAFEELDRLPADVVRDAFEPWTGPAPDLERLDDSLRRAHRLPLRTPRLRTLESARDADVLDLGPIAEEQLRVAGKTWDGQDLEPWDRLDGEREDSFAGTLERRVLGEGGKPLFDAMLFGEGSGVIFRAGTTQVVGMVADHRVESTDRTARAALEVALREAPITEEAVPSTVAATSVARAPAPVQVVVAPHVVEEPIPSPVAASVVAARQVELPFAAPRATPPEAPIETAAPESTRSAKPKKVVAKKKAAARTPPPSEPAPKKKTVAKKKAAAAVPAPKKKTVAKKKAATKKKTTRSSAE